MCGLCGIVGPSSIAAIDQITRMRQRLAHRGPDDSGTWQNHFGERSVALGHTRLSILDLSELGHQPMVSQSGDVVIAYNGEVYNHRELRRELEREGCRFRSDCDTEVVLEAYRVWGDDAFARFNGMFAIAIWDGRRERLVLARDRLGIKPLYYRFADGLLTFASELGALREHPGFRREIRRSALETYLRFGWTTGREAIYADTWRVLPGHLLVWEAGAILERPYWRLLDQGPSEDPGSYEEIVERLEQLLGDAVERRLMADVPLGAFLSGGIDSSAVVALMKERSVGTVRTFSIGFEEPGFDEAPHARAVAEHLGTEHTELYVNHAQACDVMRELPSLYDEPYSDNSAVPTVLLSRMTRESVTVALSGDGGDELFGGYDRYGKLARLLPLMGLPRAAKRLLGAFSPILGRSLRNGLLRLEGAADVPDLAEGFLDGFLGEPPVAGRDREASSSIFRETFEAAPVDSPLRRAMYAEARTYLNDDILVKVDRASMSVGLEARVPLLDHHVVEFAFGLPVEVLRRNGLSKAPLRSLLYRRVPRRLIDRPKQGFAFPVRGLLGAELDAWTERYLETSRVTEEGLLDAEAVSRLVARARAQPGLWDVQIWRLVCFQRWHARNHLGEP